MSPYLYYNVAPLDFVTNDLLGPEPGKAMSCAWLALSSMSMMSDSFCPCLAWIPLVEPLRNKASRPLCLKLLITVTT